MKKKAIWIIPLLIFTSIILTLALNKNKIKYFVAKNELKRVNIDSLSKYYQLFKLQQINNDYKKQDFIDFIKLKNKELTRFISQNNIGLNSQLKSEREGVFEGFYHYGPDRLDNEARNVINFYKSPYLLNGDMLIPLKNYFNIRINNIYIIDTDSIIELMKFNPISILAKSKKCGTDKVKMKLDTVEYYSSAFKFNRQILQIESVIEEKTKKILLNDSVLLNVIKKNTHVYVPFEYKTLDYFYCLDENKFK